jgi:uncharacterized protein YgiM (DUF1202 family)
MMRRCALVALLVLTAACEESTPPVTDSTPARMAIEIRYVHGEDSVDVHARPSADSPVIVKFLPGETVSILSRRGEWVEARTATGSGWLRASALRDAAAAKQEDDNLTPRFRKAPAPVTQPSARGEIVLEATVNTDGDVTSVKTLSNTTGTDSLVAQNTAALRGAKFYPIVQKGKRREFIYEYRVHY